MRYLNFANAPTTSRGGGSERLVVALDISPSMDDGDWPPSRLHAAKAAAVALIERKKQISPDDEVGIVAYSSDATVVHPPLRVGESAGRLIEALEPLETGSGTNISAALQAAKRLLLPQAPRSWIDRVLPPVPLAHDQMIRRVILLTDGYHNVGRSPASVARGLKTANVCIDCVGIGGNPDAVDEALMKTIASKHADGVTPRYVFIGDRGDLIEKFEELAGRITR